MAVYCATDLHGDYRLWKEIQNYLKEEDTLIYLGDAIDRGGRGFEIYLEMLNDSRVTYLLGNHETLMYCALLAKYPNASKDWYKNGGEATVLNLREVKEKNNWDLFDDILPLVKKIAKMDFLTMYENANGTKSSESKRYFNTKTRTSRTRVITQRQTPQTTPDLTIFTTEAR